MILRYIILLTLERAQVGFKSGRAGEANFCDAVLVRGDGPNHRWSEFFVCVCNLTRCVPESKSGSAHVQKDECPTVQCLVLHLLHTLLSFDTV